MLICNSRDSKGDKPKTKDIATSYLPLWQIAENWRDLFVIDEAKFYDHIQKGNALADRGKTSAAITEYQAAYDLIEDSTIPVKIKKLREQSLGL